MMTLTAHSKASLNHFFLEWIDLTSRIPLSDPGAWYSVLYGHFPGADLQLAGPSAKRLDSQIIKAAEENSLKFLLIDLDQHPWLAHEPAGLQKLIKDANAHGLRIVPFSDDQLPTVEVCKNREAAIEVCLSEWEEQLLERFWW